MGNSTLPDSLLELLSDAVAVADAGLRVLKVNRAFEKATGLLQEKVLGQDFSSLWAEPLALAEDLTSGGFSQSGMVSLKLPEGGVKRFSVNLSLQKRDDDTSPSLLAVLHDLEASQSTKARIGVDPLTGLPNRQLFHDRAEQNLLNAKRSAKSLALLLVGLDRFSVLNDALGHGGGDALLKEVAERLKKCVRVSDTAARLGSDQFGLILPISAADDSVIVAEKVLRSLRDPFHVEGREVVLSASVGISLYPADADSADRLMKNADSAMHHAKVMGRDQYQFYAGEMNDRARKRLDLEHRLRRALTQQEFVLYYQPKIRVDSDSLTGMEALIRWMEPSRGMISPADFIPVAEESGLIGPIGLWVLKEACRQNKEWQDKGLKPVRVSVNVSAHQFRDRDLIEKVHTVLDQTGMEPKWLELELTESMLVGDIEQVVTKMKALRDLGIHLSIDDFGTGYSSLSYLARFPITTLKIDRAFVKDVETNPFTAEIARAIIGLSRGLNLEVVAEGAELAAQVDFLRENGCDMVQGFYFSKPLPPAEFEARLRESSKITA
ncbi:MAG: EAL domain-containing protein [Rhodospirillales bacterium]|jgi:diguanylate cyclase (GGDEF)-like protein/PAS domain S-box-containing protein